MSPNAYRQLLLTEAKLMLREPWVLFWGVGFPVILTIVLGAAGHHPDRSLGGLSVIDAYVPVTMAMAITLLAVSATPQTLASYRERGILKRLQTTPMRPLALIGADFAVAIAVILVAIALIAGIGRIAFSVQLPSDVGGFVVTLILTGAAMLGLGATVAALASSTKVAAAIGTILFFPMMFFAGLWIPRQQMSAGLRDVSDYTPLGAANAAIQQTMHGTFPSASHLLVLAVYAVVLGIAAIRLFRWE